MNDELEMENVYFGHKEKPDEDELVIDDEDPTDWEEKYEELLFEHIQLNKDYDELESEHVALKKKYEPNTILGKVNQWINKKKWIIFAGIAVVGFIIGAIVL